MTVNEWALIRLSCAVQSQLNDLVLKALNGSEISENDQRQLRVKLDRLNHVVSEIAPPNKRNTVSGF
ncbi:MAG TPA: hypothetical protein PKN87_04705 [Syntrophomonadaceae bacterium]|nr:hypothetical protein [Syntrophomonadaceae bacterium]HNX28697.1 hypothetical protein [Syntrophomonadaceae bacterium]HPR93505.1 hypothetical protein [Syntrophomonadaceae bacterium]HPR93507.1 hypothetical protein [Syntrophomonadaceae bacterium]